MCKKGKIIRFAALIAVFAVALASLCGCGKKTTQDEDKLSVVCTIFPQYDFVRQIAGDRVNLKMLVPFGVESHDFNLEALSRADLKTVNGADVFIYVGGESDESWVTKLSDTAKGEGSIWAALCNMTDGLFEADAASMEEEQEHGEEEEEEYDEHVWTSPKRAIAIVEKITEILCEKDTDNAESYKENSEKYIAELKAFDGEFTAISENKITDTAVFADRFPFRYLFSDYGINFDAAFNGCSSVCDPSALQLESLCRTANEKNAKVIFYMENSKTVYAEMIAEKVGAKPMLLHSCHTVTKEEWQQGVTYVSLMKKNAEALSEALL